MAPIKCARAHKKMATFSWKEIATGNQLLLRERENVLEPRHILFNPRGSWKIAVYYLLSELTVCNETFPFEHQLNFAWFVAGILQRHISWLKNPKYKRHTRHLCSQRSVMNFTRINNVYSSTCVYRVPQRWIIFCKPHIGPVWYWLRANIGQRSRILCITYSLSIVHRKH